MVSSNQVETDEISRYNNNNMYVTVSQSNDLSSLKFFPYPRYDIHVVKELFITVIFHILCEIQIRIRSLRHQYVITSNAQYFMVPYRTVP